MYALLLNQWKQTRQTRVFLVAASKAEKWPGRTYSQTVSTSKTKIKREAVGGAIKVPDKTTTTIKTTLEVVEGVWIWVDPHLFPRTNTRSKDATIFATENYNTLWGANSFNQFKINLGSRRKASSVLLKWQPITPTIKLWSSNTASSQSWMLLWTGRCRQCPSSSTQAIRTIRTKIPMRLWRLRLW